MNEQEKLNIPIIVGTDREDRKSIYAARFVESVGKSNFDEINCFVVDIKDFKPQFDGNDSENKVPSYSKIVQEADAFYIVTPEYNHSFPGSLKTVLDTELKHYIHKPVVMAGVSSGNMGGVRAIENLLSPLREYGMIISFADVYFSRIQDRLDGNNLFTKEANEEFTPRVTKAFTELIWLAKTMKWGRENLKNKYHE